MSYLFAIVMTAIVAVLFVALFDPQTTRENVGVALVVSAAAVLFGLIAGGAL